MLGVCAITLYFTVQLTLAGISYFSLKNRAQAQITQWEILPVKNQFALQATYRFKDKENFYEGVFTLTPPYYLNEGSAFNSLKEKAKSPWDVWYNPKDPRASALEKEFPLGLIMRTAVCYGVLIYFFSLYKRVARL